MKILSFGYKVQFFQFPCDGGFLPFRQPAFNMFLILIREIWFGISFICRRFVIQYMF